MPDNHQLLIKNVSIASMQDNGVPYGAVENAFVTVNDGKIGTVGSMQDTLPKANEIIDAEGQWLLPGFVDCHTHLVFGGSRSGEFEQRLNGVSYEQIARQGGGIKSTVQATRKESKDSLTSSAVSRASRLAEEGVTTIEVKSGYGLDRETELKMLEAAKAIERHLPVNIATTYLGAHAVPAEFTGQPDAYIDYVCETVMPEIARRKLATSVDVFCESIGFSPEQCERVFERAEQLGLAVKAHVEQLSDLKGAVLAAKHGALSVDHIEYLSAQDIPALKASNTTAVLLPGAYYYLGETQRPPVDALRQHGIPMAVATDLNPGSSPVASLLTCLNMACVLFALTPEEALRGATCHAAGALGLKSKGVVAPGMDADLCLWDIARPAELVYGINFYRPSAKWLGGKRV